MARLLGLLRQHLAVIFISASDPQPELCEWPDDKVKVPCQYSGCEGWGTWLVVNRGVSTRGGLQHLGLIWTNCC